MRLAQQKELLCRFSPAAMAATLLLALAGTLHPAHAASSAAVACPPTPAAHKAVKHGVKKQPHRLAHRHHLIAKRHPVVVRIAEAPAPGYRVLVSADYQRIIPEQNCNMEPAWAVPACLQRVMRTSLE